MMRRASERLKLAAASAAMVTWGDSASNSVDMKPSYLSVSAVEPLVPRIRAIRFRPPMILIA